MTDKIKSQHRQRLAVVYVRQSSPGQVKNNTESRRRQRDLNHRAKQLGWTDSQILVLEEQQAKTGSSTSQREAYRQLAERVAQGQVGIIFAVEVARWARDNVAWQLLLRDCVFCDVLLADEHRIYDPNDDHDHVYLGIQGVLAENELRKLRERMLDCWWKKARRGEFFSAIATGYIEVRGQGLRKHPNTRVQNSLERMFGEFRHTPSATRLCQAYLERNEDLPYVEHGDDPYNVQWRPASYHRMLAMLKNPLYAGAFILGRSKTVVHRNEDGELIRRRHDLPPEQWEVMEKDRFPAYISWQQYEQNLAKIRGNVTVQGRPSQSAPGRGSSLLAGLLRCGRCGHEIHVRYQWGKPRYVCRGGGRQRGRHRLCLSFSGRHVEPLFSQMVLEVVRPAGVRAAYEAAVQLQEQADGQRQRMLDEVTQLRYEAERVRRQYDRVEPENRLVAAELERRWNEALQEVAAAEARWEGFREESSQRVSEDDLRRLSQLGQQLERVWDASDTDPSIKKQIVRLLVREVTADVDESRGEVELWVDWSGGHHTVLHAPRAGRRGRSAAEAAKSVIGLLRAVCDDRGIAHALNRNGLSSRTGSWTAAEVRRVRQRHGIAPFSEVEKQREGLLSQEEAARELQISPMSVHRLVHRGILPAEQVGAGFPSIIRRTDLALEEVQQAVHCIHTSLPRPLPDDPNQLKLF